MGHDQMKQPATAQSPQERESQGRWNEPDRQLATRGQGGMSATGESSGAGWQGYVVPYRYYGPGYAGLGYYAVYFQGEPETDDPQTAGGRWSEQDRFGRRRGFAGRGPQGYQRSDQRIEEEINDHLTDHDELDASNLRVSVKDGVATLTGRVDSRSDKRLAGDIAERARGVRDVMNQVVVDDARPWSQGTGGRSGMSGSERDAAGGVSSGVSGSRTSDVRDQRQPAAASTGSTSGSGTTPSSGQKNGS